MQTIDRFPTHKYLFIGLVSLFFAVPSAAFGQSPERKNNPYAPSPAGNSRQAVPQIQRNNEFASIRSGGSPAEALTQKVKYELPKPSALSPEPLSVSPVNIYRIGVNDVLHIKLANASGGSAYYPVRKDGTIDFPLAGDNVDVKGLTVSDVAQKLKKSIKLFADPRVEVVVTEYASHSVMISGKVKNPGEKFLRREAVPLFVIKSEAIVDTGANAVKISTGSGETRTYLLNDSLTDTLLIDSGTTLEFIKEDVHPQARYFIAGSETKTSERPLSPGLTLSQAATSLSAEARKATIHRKDKTGNYIATDYDLRAIIARKSVDPIIESGDIIRIRN